MHVNRFYHSLGALTPKGENSQIARDILMDIIGSSGLDLRGIEEILKGAIPDVRGISGKSRYLISIPPQFIRPYRGRSEIVAIEMSPGPRSIPVPTKNGTHTVCIYRYRQTAFVHQGCGPR